MALNPSISTQIKSAEFPDTLDIANNYANLIKNRALAENLSATTATTQMTNARKQASLNWDAQNMGKFTGPDGKVDYVAAANAKAAAGFPAEAQDISTTGQSQNTLQVGNTQAVAAEKAKNWINWQTEKGKDYIIADKTDPAKTVVDVPRMVSDAAKEGFVAESMPVYKEWLANEGTKIANSNSKVDFDNKVLDLSRKAGGYYSQVIQSVPDAQRLQTVNNIAHELNSTAPGSADKLFGPPDKNGVYKVPSQVDLSAMYNRAITPLEERTLAISAAQAAAGIQLTNLQSAAMRGEGGLMSPELRTAQVNLATSKEASANLLEEAAAAASRLRSKSGGLIGDKFESWIGRHLDDPDVGIYQQGAALMPQIGGTELKPGVGFDMAGASLGAMAKKLRQEASSNRSQALPAGKNTGVTSTPAAPVVTPKPQKPEQVGKPGKTPGTVSMRSADGSFKGDIPLEKVEAAKKRGLILE